MRRVLRDAGVWCLLAAAVFLLPGCEDDEDTCPLAPEASAQFVLNLTPVYLSVGPGEYAVDAAFATNDLSVVPSVVVNGALMCDFDVEYGLLRGSVVAPFDPKVPVIHFGIAADGRTASDSLTVSFEKPEGITCNGREVIYDFTIQVPDSSDYTFRWDCDDCDGFLVQIRKEYGDRPPRQLLELQTADDSLTVDAAVFAGYTGVTFRVGRITGVALVPGATPNVTGTYGAGFVTCMPPLGLMQEAYVEIQSPAAQNPGLTPAPPATP